MDAVEQLDAAARVREQLAEARSAAAPFEAAWSRSLYAVLASADAVARGAGRPG